MSGTQKISQTDTDWCCRRTHSSPLGSLPLPVPSTLYHSYRSCLSPVCSGTPAPHTRNGCFTPTHKTKLNRGGLSFRWPSCSSNRSAVTGPERTIHKKNYLRQTMSGAARNRSGLWQKRLWVFKWKVRTEKVRKKLFQLWVKILVPEIHKEYTRLVKLLTLMCLMFLFLRRLTPSFSSEAKRLWSPRWMSTFFFFGNDLTHIQTVLC